MKNSSKTISLIIAAAVSGAALFELANASFIAAVRGDVVLAVAASVAVIGLAVYDYSRRTKSLQAPGDVVRPALRAPVAEVCPLESDCDHRAAA